jgi:hypothetical protein
MAVTLDAVGTHKVITSTGTGANTFTGLTISAGLTNSVAVFSIVYGNGQPTFSSVTWNGVACTQIGNASLSGSGGIAWFGIVNPASGNQTFSFTPSVSVEAYVEGCSFQNVNQTGGTTTFAHFVSNVVSTPVTTKTLAVTTVSGNFTCMAVLPGTPAATVFTAPVGSQIYRDATDPAGNGTNAAAAQAASTTTSTSYTAANSSSDTMLMAGFDLLAAAGGAVVTIGWSRPSDTDRLPWPMRPDKSAVESLQFFTPSPNPVPTTWLPTTGEEDRPPALKRPPDEPRLNTYFVRSPNPVPTTWLPTTGEEDRPPAQKRPPDEPRLNTYFIRSPNPVPTTWLPTTGEEDRPPAQKRPPDEPRLNTYFVRSPNPVPTTWLPQWDGWEKPKRVAADPSATVQVLRAITSVVPISGIAWNIPSEDKERPAPFKPTPGNNFFAVQIPAAVATWLPTTGQEDRPPNPNRQRTDESFNWFVRSPHPVPTTWLPQWDGWERPKPAIPDASGEAFVFRPVTATVPISGIAWNTLSEDKERPTPYRPTPGNSFFSVQVPVATAPVSGMAWNTLSEDKERLPPFHPAPGNNFFSVQIPTSTVPVSGIAWYTPGEDKERWEPYLPTPGNSFFSVQVPTSTVPVSGIAWYTPSEDKERWKPYLPTPGNNFFSLQVPISSTIAGIGWLIPSDNGPPPPKDDPSVIQTLPPFIAPPLQSFYAAANADDFNPLPRPREFEGATTQTFRSFAAPVGIAGIAWWQPVQVFLEPLPSYRDYHLAWDPQFIVQIPPPTQNLFLRPLMGFGL